MVNTDMRSGPVRGKSPGVAAIDYNGERYCLDCAADALDGQSLSFEKVNGEWVSVENADGEDLVEQLVSGDIHTLGQGGVVLKHSTDGVEDWHCSASSRCTNALEGDEHSYDHDESVGVYLDI